MADKQLTKQELDAKVAEQAEEIAQLKAQVGKLKEENGRLRQELEAAQAATAPPATVPKTCINCGQHRTPINVIAVTSEDDEPATAYQCPICKHIWTDADEQAPFRREV